MRTALPIIIRLFFALATLAAAVAPSGGRAAESTSRIQVSVVYVRQTGTVVVEVTPDNASWSFTDGNGALHSGSGNATVPSVDAGSIALSWETLSGYDPLTPNSVMKQLVKDGTVIFREIYVPTSGDLPRKKAQILRYLLGLSADSTGLNVNGDATVDVADLVYLVESQPPSMPSGPQPADGATTLSVTTDLNWTPCLRGRSYDLYLWKSTDSKPTTPTAAGLITNHYDPLTTLTYSTTYQWQVVAINGSTRTSGPEWTFTTKPQVVFALSPNGGETWTRGSAAQIHWKTNPQVAGTAVRFELWRDGVKIEEIGIGYSETGESTNTITVPSDLSAGIDYKLRVVSLWMDGHGGGPDSWDESDGFITVN
jgi:hypothetical protein